MIKKIKKIKFQDFNNETEFFEYLIQNDIIWLEDDIKNKIHYSNAARVWAENKPEDLKKFKS